MWFSVLEIIQKASVELGLGKPAIAVSNTEPTTLQMVGLLTSVGEELTANYDWSFLINTHTFTTQVGVTTYDLPTNFLRFKKDECDTIVEEVHGDKFIAPNKFRISRCDSGELISGKIVGNQFVIDVVPTEEVEYEFDFLSNAWVIDGSTKGLKPVFESDGDKQIFNDRLIINGLKLKFKEINGFSTVNAVYDFEQVLNSVRSSEINLKTLELAPSRTLNNPNVPLSDWTV